MTSEELQLVASAQARLDVVEARSRFVDEALSAMTREEIQARRGGSEDEISQAVSNLVLAQALHTGYGEVLMNANAEYHQAVNEIHLLCEDLETLVDR